MFLFILIVFSVIIKNPHGLLFVETLKVQGGASGLIISNVHRSKTTHLERLQGLF
jgi:hypothetical protein